MPSTTDAIAVLENDHRTVERLFREFERARQLDAKERLARRISRELSIHAAIEEQLFYPRLRAAIERRPSEPRVVLALEEHHLVKVGLAEIGALPASHERFDAKVHVLIEDVRQHVSEEERELFPLLRRLLSREELEKLGSVLLRARRIAPTRPHPTAPDEPPGVVFVGLAAGAYDRSRDTLEWTTGVAVERGRLLVARALRAGEDAVRSARRRLGREVAPAAVERRVARGRNAARRAQRRLGEGIEQAGRDLQPATVH